jgi:hypothetical protein
MVGPGLEIMFKLPGDEEEEELDENDPVSILEYLKREGRGKKQRKRRLGDYEYEEMG